MTPAARARVLAERRERLGLNPDVPPRHHPACPARALHRCIPAVSAVDPDCSCRTCSARFSALSAAQVRAEAMTAGWSTRRPRDAGVEEPAPWDEIPPPV